MGFSGQRCNPVPGHLRVRAKGAYGGMLDTVGKAKEITMILINGWSGVFAILFAFVCMASPASAEHQRIVSGIIVNIGVIPAGEALNRPDEAAAHGNRQPGGAQHMVVTLSDAKQGIHIADAQVTVEIKDPKGNVERKTLAPASTTGMPDYSGIFSFGYSGKYAIRVIAVLKGSKRRIRANFTWTHVVT